MLRTTLQTRIASLADPDYLAGIAQAVPTEWHILGVRVPALRALAREMQQDYPDLTAGDLCLLLDDAFADHGREEVLCLIFWLARRWRQLTVDTWRHLDGWLDEVADWEICDQLAMGIGAPIVNAHPELTDPLTDWTRADSEWRRRFTLATAAALNQKGRSNVDVALALARPLLNDPSPNVRKAVGWALREVSKQDPDAVYAFLRAHKADTHPAVLRQSAQKLPDSMRKTL